MKLEIRELEIVSGGKTMAALFKNRQRSKGSKAFEEGKQQTEVF